jgi:hypothetical protein
VATAARQSQKNSYATAQLLNFARDSYLERTSRPIYAILFLLPFIIFYEIGTIPDQHGRAEPVPGARGGVRLAPGPAAVAGDREPVRVDRSALGVIVILVGLQIASKKQWYFCLSDYTPMVLECILLAVPLIVLSLFSNSPGTSPITSPGSTWRAGRTGRGVAAPPPVVRRTRGRRSLSGRAATDDAFAHDDIVTGVGAGIYEELVFRLILICF